jgi:hypothetical protein
MKSDLGFNLITVSMREGEGEVCTSDFIVRLVHETLTKQTGLQTPDVGTQHRQRWIIKVSFIFYLLAHLNIMGYGLLKHAFETELLICLWLL